MTTFVHSYCSRHVLCLDHKEYENIKELKNHLHKTKGVPLESCFLVCNGALVDDEEPVQENVVYHTYIRLVGGKGGFGSMLRAIGAQIDKTTNHDACRDLSGRRMRDVNVEKDLKDWLAKKAERDKEKEQRRQDRMARRRAMPHHKFEDPLYEKQRELISQNQEDALQKGLKKVTTEASTPTASTSGKRKAETSSSDKVKKKKGTEWLGVDMDMSDLDSEEDGSDSSSSDGRSASAKLEPHTSDSVSPDTSGSNGPSTSSTGHLSGMQDEIKTENIVEQADSEVRDVAISDVKNVVKETKNEDHQESESKDTTEYVAMKVEPGDVETENVKKEFCLDDMKSLEEVQQVGMEVLKAELMSRGLKCGGTLEQRAERLFSVKGLSVDDIDPSLFAKSNGKNVKKKK